MLRFKRAGMKWWRKPLVFANHLPTTAELAVLAAELHPSEAGAWLSSRSQTGVVELQIEPEALVPTFRTKRIQLPKFVSSGIDKIRQLAGFPKGCPDLAIWNLEQSSFRLIEVKCPHWDSSSREQDAFMQAAKHLGIKAAVVEWEFDD